MPGEAMPLATHPRENTVHQPVPTQTTGAPLQVLLVEDSPVIRESVVELIEGSGRARVAYSTDSEPAAINELKSNPYDVVIVDLRLREGSGFGVLRAVRILP